MLTRSDRWVPDSAAFRRTVRRGLEYAQAFQARATGRIRYRGSRVRCPCCGSTYREFAPYNGPDRICWRCGSLERDRLLWLLFTRRPELLRPGLDVLHIAPERALRPRLQRVAGKYVAGDIDRAFGKLRLDVTQLDVADESFDAVICNHVLEHVEDDRAALRELRRVLRPGGWAILLVPDMVSATTAEDPTIEDPALRQRLFGQRDHVRRYGWDYLDRLFEAGFRTEVINMESEISSEAIDRYRLKKFGQIEPIFFCR